jgi:hypothetical protein
LDEVNFEIDVLEKIFLGFFNQHPSYLVILDFRLEILNFLKIYMKVLVQISSIKIKFAVLG